MANENQEKEDPQPSKNKNDERKNEVLANQDTEWLAVKLIKL